MLIVIKKHAVEITLVALTLIFSGIIIAYAVTNHSTAKIEKSNLKFESQTENTKTPQQEKSEIPTSAKESKEETKITTTESINYPININSATANDLCYKVPGLGEVLASRIVEYREIYGNFSSVDDLLIISGIGEEKLNELRPYITV